MAFTKSGLGKATFGIVGPLFRTKIGFGRAIFGMVGPLFRTKIGLGRAIFGMVGPLLALDVNFLVDLSCHYTRALIRESVDSLSRDGADAQIIYAILLSKPPKTRPQRRYKLI